MLYLSLEEAQRRLSVPNDLFSALLASGLLGYYDRGHLPLLAIEHYERFGTQWRPELGGRRIPAEHYQNAMCSSDSVNSGVQPPSTLYKIMISPSGSVAVDTSRDTGWLAQFYLKPNEFFFPNPYDLTFIGPLNLKLEGPRLISGKELPTRLYPDPIDSLAMISVLGNPQPEEFAFDIAYDVVTPILDELSVQYDQPLHVAQSITVGIPSGTIPLWTTRGPVIKTIGGEEPITSLVSHPELREAIALYREGISSNSPFHAFLTLWKVYENSCKVRGDWRRIHKKPYTKIIEEVFPTLFALQAHSGCTFDEAKKKMNDVYRNAIAHADPQIGKVEPKTSASAADWRKVVSEVPSIRFMARIVIENVRATLDSTNT